MKSYLHSSRALLGSGVSLLAVCAGMVMAAPAIAQTAPAASPADDEVTVVVTARRQALLSATERKKNADTIIDSVVADEAGKLPDNSITEVLQRVSGVSVVRFASLGDPDHYSAEGSGVQVRGLSGVAGFLNGREVFSANGGRGLMWGDVTPELMAAVDIYKSSKADLIEGGTGGSIDLRTKMPFDYKKAAFQANLGYTRGDLSETTTPSASILLTKRWQTPVGEFGALIDLAASKFDNSSHFVRMQPYYRTQVANTGGATTRAGNVAGGVTDKYLPGGMTYGTDNYSRDRTGIYGAFQWRPNDDLTIYTTLFESKYEQEGFGSGVFVTSTNLTLDPAAQSSAVFDGNGALIKGTLITRRASDGVTAGNVGGSISAGGNTGVSQSRSVTRDWSTGFRWQASDSLRLTGALQFVDSTRKQKNYDVFPAINFPNTMTIDLTGDLPQVTLPASAAATFSNLANYRWNATQDHIESNHGSMVAANIDAEWQLPDEGFFTSVKAGVRYAERTEHDGVSAYNWTALGQTWNGGEVRFNNPRTQPGDIEARSYENFFRGDANLPANVIMPSLAMVRRFDPVTDHSNERYGGNPVSPIGIKPHEYSDAYTKTKAAYVMANFASDKGLFGVPFSGNVGLRIVGVENYSEGFFVQSASTFLDDGVFYRTSSNATNALPNKGGATFIRALPSLNVQFKPSDELRLRFAYSVTMDNQSFNSLKANGVISVEAEGADGGIPGTLNTFSSTLGNPELKPTMAENFDISAEYYKGRSFNAHLSLFSKKLRDTVATRYDFAQYPITYIAGNQTAGSVVFVPGFVGTRMEEVRTRRLINADQDATIQGFEIGARKFFDELPAPFDGLGIEANYTYIDSKNPGDLALGINNTVKTSNTLTQNNFTLLKDANGRPAFTEPLLDNPVAGLSEHNANITAMYEKGPWSVRVAYSWRSPYLMSTAANGTQGTYIYYDYVNGKREGKQFALPNWSDEFGSLDFGASYKINEHYRVSVNAQNLTNTVTKTLMKGYPNNANYTRSWFVSDQRINIGLSIAY